MSKRIVVLGSLLSLAALLCAASFLHVEALERELEEMACAKRIEFRKAFEEAAADRVRIGSSVVASKGFLVFGRVTGKISIFVEHSVAGRQDRFVEGYEFFYQRSEDGWDETDSGRCTSELCTLQGKKVLEALDVGPG